MQLSATSSVDAPFVLVERFRKGLTQLGVVFYQKGGAAIDLTGQQFVFEINDGATAVVQISLIGGLTQPASNKLLITLSDSDKTRLRRNGYGFTLYNLTRERMELTGVLNWKSRSANATAVTTAPDVRLDIDTVTGTVTINGVVFQGQQGPQGYKGWNPVLGVAVRNNDRVWQLLDYSGGEGVKPTEFLGWYVGYSGYVQSIDSAVNVRGLQGVKGDVGTRWFVGNADPIAQGAGNAASFAPNAEALVGDIYLNADTGSTYKLLGSGNWSQQNGNLRGPIGWKGWCPVYALIVDGARTVKQLIDWTAGEGVKPTAFIGQYLGATGYVPNIANAVDIRGPKGDAGTLTASAFVDILPLLTDKLVYQRADGSLAKSDPSTGYPATRPTLLLDFAGAGMVSPAIQHTRAGAPLSYFDRMGVLRYAPANVPAIDFDPATGRCLGLSIWEQRTNLFTKSAPSTLSFNPSNIAITTNAASWLDGTMTATVFTTTAANSPMNFTNGAAGSWTTGTQVAFSLYIKSTVGNDASFRIYFGSGLSVGGAFDVFAFTNGVVSLVSGAATVRPAKDGWYRIERVITLTQDVTSLNFTFGDLDSGLTFAIHGMQIELGTVVSPVIITTTGSVTRGNGTHSLDLLSAWFRQGQGTIYLETQTNAVQINTSALDLWQDNTNKISIRLNQILVASTGGGGSSGGFPSGSLQRIAFRYAAGDARAFRNGTNVSGPVSPTIPAAFSKMYLGITDTNLYWLNGYIRTIRYYPALLTDSELIAITSY